MNLLSDIFVILLNGLQQGAICALLAVGLSIVLGTLKSINFAHGVLYLVGAHAGLFVAPNVPLSNRKLAEWSFLSFGLDIDFLAALLFAPLFVSGVGLLTERYLARAFYDRPDADQILVTFGLTIVVQELLHILLSSNSLLLEQPERILSVSSFVGIPAPSSIASPVVGNFPQWRLRVIDITAVLVALVHLLIECTDFGLAARTGTRDAGMIRLFGIKIAYSYTVVSGIGAAPAGVMDVVDDPSNVVNPIIGTNILVSAFLTVVTGRTGNIVGAVVGGIVFGFTIAVFVSSAPAWSQAGLCAITATVLPTRSQGLLGDKEMAP